MKRTFHFWISFFSLVIISTVQGYSQQNTDEVFKKIEQAIKAGDADGLSVFFNKSLEVTLQDKDQVYSKNQAQFVIKDFFIKHPAKSFTFIHRGNSQDRYYGMGTFESSNGKFDTNVFIKKYGDVYFIDQIRFEEGN
jgi:hypothetical protein